MNEVDDKLLSATSAGSGWATYAGDYFMTVVIFRRHLWCGSARCL